MKHLLERSLASLFEMHEITTRLRDTIVQIMSPTSMSPCLHDTSKAMDPHVVQMQKAINAI